MGKLDAITRRTSDEKAGLKQRLFREGQLDLSPNVNRGQLDPNMNEGKEDPNIDPRMLENLSHRKRKNLYEDDHG